MGGPWSRYLGSLSNWHFFCFSILCLLPTSLVSTVPETKPRISLGIRYFKNDGNKREQSHRGGGAPRGESGLAAATPLPQLCASLSFEKTARTVLGSGWSQLLVLFVKWD